MVLENLTFFDPHSDDYAIIVFSIDSFYDQNFFQRNNKLKPTSLLKVNTEILIREKF